MTDLLVRPAILDDVKSVQKIYAHHVLNGTGSFEITPPDLQEMQRRFNEVLSRGLPYLVAELEGRVAGYAYANLYRVREAYRFTAEDSVYIDPAFQKRGVGEALLAELILRTAQAGFKQMVAVIGGGRENAGSVRLHEKQGFVHVGLLPKVGFKFDRWHDSVLMQRGL